MADAFARARDVEVVERVPGSSSTDFWGIAHVPSEIEREVLSPADLERRLDLLRRAGRTSTTSLRASPATCGPDPAAPGARATRSSATCTATSRSRCHARSRSERPLEVVLTPEGLATHRQAYLDAFRAYNAEGKPARTWPIQFLVRRTAYHVMDHAWEMEDRAEP